MTKLVRLYGIMTLNTTLAAKVTTKKECQRIYLAYAELASTTGINVQQYNHSYQPTNRIILLPAADCSLGKSREEGPIRNRLRLKNCSALRTAVGDRRPNILVLPSLDNCALTCSVL